MATAEQMEFFRSLYEEEEKRYGVLLDHSKNNLTLTSIYSAFVIFVLEKQLSTIDKVGVFLFIGSLSAIAISFFLSLFATNISDFEALTDPEDLIKNFKKIPPTNEEFFDERIIDYTVAYKKNSCVNDRKALWLCLARYALLVGIFLHAAYFIYAVT